jgi:hypothetical protein
MDLREKLKSLCIQRWKGDGSRGGELNSIEFGKQI